MREAITRGRRGRRVALAQERRRSEGGGGPAREDDVGAGERAQPGVPRDDRTAPGRPRGRKVGGADSVRSSSLMAVELYSLDSLLRRRKGALRTDRRGARRTSRDLAGFGSAAANELNVVPGP